MVLLIEAGATTGGPSFSRAVSAAAGASPDGRFASVHVVGEHLHGEASPVELALQPRQRPALVPPHRVVPVPVVAALPGVQLLRDLRSEPEGLAVVHVVLRERVPVGRFQSTVPATSAMTTSTVGGQAIAQPCQACESRLTEAPGAVARSDPGAPSAAGARSG